MDDLEQWWASTNPEPSRPEPWLDLTPAQVAEDIALLRRIRSLLRQARLGADDSGRSWLVEHLDEVIAGVDGEVRNEEIRLERLEHHGRGL